MTTLKEKMIRNEGIKALVVEEFGDFKFFKSCPKRPPIFGEAEFKGHAVPVRYAELMRARYII